MSSLIPSSPGSFVLTFLYIILTHLWPFLPKPSQRIFFFFPFLLKMLGHFFWCTYSSFLISFLFTSHIYLNVLLNLFCSLLFFLAQYSFSERKGGPPVILCKGHPLRWHLMTTQYSTSCLRLCFPCTNLTCSTQLEHFNLFYNFNLSQGTWRFDIVDFRLKEYPKMLYWHY